MRWRRRRSRRRKELNSVHFTLFAFSFKPINVARLNEHRFWTKILPGRKRDAAAMPGVQFTLLFKHKKKIQNRQCSYHFHNGNFINSIVHLIIRRKQKNSYILAFTYVKVTDFIQNGKIKAVG